MIDSGRENFNQEYITRELNRVDGVLTEKLSIYLLGGAVMAMNGLKPGTKDIGLFLKTPLLSPMRSESILRFMLVRISDTADKYTIGCP